MARRRAHAPLSVFVNARPVGTLEREPTGAIAFTYAGDWLGWAPAFPVSRKAFKLSLAVGRSRHYRIEEIVPRHFSEIADLAGVSKSAMCAITADLAETAVRVVEDVAAALPGGFPEPIVASVAAAVVRRAKLCAESAS